MFCFAKLETRANLQVGKTEMFQQARYVKELTKARLSQLLRRMFLVGQMIPFDLVIVKIIG